MEVKKPFFRTKSFHRILYLLLISLSFCLTAGEVGILSTLPLAVLLPFAAAFFYFEPFSASAVAALSAAAVSVFSGKPLAFIALFALAAFIATLLLTLTARMYIAANIKRTVKIAVTALLLLSLSVAYFFTFGNPVSALLSKSDARDYLKNNYPDVSFSIENTCYDPSEKQYVHTLTFESLGETHRASLSLDSRAHDGYFQYVTGLDITRCRTRLMKLLRTVTDAPMTPYSILPNDTAIEGKLSSDGNNLFVDSKVCHYIAFDFETPAETDFIEACDPLVKAVLSSDLPFASITLYGGLGTRTDTFLYELTITPKSPADAALTDCRPFDKKSYDARKNPNKFRH